MRLRDFLAGLGLMAVLVGLLVFGGIAIGDALERNATATTCE